MTSYVVSGKFCIWKMSTLTICCANLVVIISLAACLISLVMDYWVKITVNRTKLPSSMLQEHKEIYYSRQRGIFRTCFEDEDDVACKSFSNHIT